MRFFRPSLKFFKASSVIFSHLEIEKFEEKGPYKEQFSLIFSKK